MRKFVVFLILTLVLVLLASILIQLRYDVEYPKQLGPVFDDNVRYNYREHLDKENPEMMLLGDSTLKDSVIFDQLGKTLGIDVYGVAVPSSSTALWYLILKNNVLTAEYKPDYLVIYTRETMMTTPEYRVDSGNNFLLIDEQAGSDEPLLLERSYLQKMSVPEQTITRYLPVFGERGQVRGSIDYRLNHILPVLFDCGEVCVGNALQVIFSGDTDPEAMMEAQNQVENYLWGIDKLFFSRQLERSYLPEIERMTRENGIQLILVEMKTLKNPPSTTTALLRNAYMHDLRTYCTEKGIYYISFADDPRLPETFFSDGFHLKPEVMPMFTDMLAEELASVVEK